MSRKLDQELIKAPSIVPIQLILNFSKLQFYLESTLRPTATGTKYWISSFHLKLSITLQHVVLSPLNLEWRHLRAQTASRDP